MAENCDKLALPPSNTRWQQTQMLPPLGSDSRSVPDAKGGNVTTLSPPFLVGGNEVATLRKVPFFPSCFYLLYFKENKDIDLLSEVLPKIQVVVATNAIFWS
jgi:hypothetical protein